MIIWINNVQRIEMLKWMYLAWTFIFSCHMKIHEKLFLTSPRPHSCQVLSWIRNTEQCTIKWLLINTLSLVKDCWIAFIQKSFARLGTNISIVLWDLRINHLGRVTICLSDALASNSDRRAPTKRCSPLP